MVMVALLMFILEVQAQGTDAKVLINDVEVFSHASLEPITKQMKVNQYVIEGDNSVVVQLRSDVPQYADSVEKPPPLMFKLSIITGELGTAPDDADTVLQYKWDPMETPLESGQWVEALSTSIPGTDAYGRWLWQDADSVELTSDVRVSIMSHLEALHSALESEDLAAVQKMLKVKHEEMARALGVDEERVLSGHEGMLQSFFSADDWRLDPLVPEEVGLSVQAGGRLVTATSTDGGPVVSGSGGGRPFVLPVTLSRVEGEWKIVR
jgi:hypothetical protein